MKKNDVKVTVANGVLTLQGERKEPHAENGRRFHRSERSYGRFARSFSLPDQIDESKVRAGQKDGMLPISLPKSKHAKPKAIEGESVVSAPNGSFLVRAGRPTAGATARPPYPLTPLNPVLLTCQI